MNHFVAVLLFAIPVCLIAVVFLPFFRRLLRRVNPRAGIFGHIALFAVSCITLMLFIFSGSASAADAAEAAASAQTGLANGLGYLAAALSTGMSTIGAGIAVASGASAAIGATSEDRKMLSKGLIFVALGEGIVLYGLLMSFMILNKLG